MLRAAFEAIQTNFSGTIEYDVPRSKFAYYRIGGEARVVASPKTFDDLEQIHTVIRLVKCPFFILGWGSNLLFSDAAFEGVVIRMKHLFTGFEKLSELNSKKGNYLKLGASLGAASLLKAASEQGFGGLTCLTGIPGSVGGMVAMNAGTHLGEIGARLIQTEYCNLLEPTLRIKTRIHDAKDFSYRRNHFLSAGDLITHTYFVFEEASPESVKNEIDALYQRRKSSQPVNLPSCGSVFMNPREHGVHAWQVIDQLGLRGKQVGQAQISEKHPNFIVNLGGASASDVRALIDLVKSEALAKLNIEMHEEVKFIP